jgi:GNAT superfamily N-acetyltransferase
LMYVGLEFVCGGPELIDEVEEMWRQLTLHASRHSPDFSHHFASRTFDGRRTELLSRTENGTLRIDIARDKASRRDLGFSACSLDRRGHGEIESLFVDEVARGRGIGDVLVRRALEWMRSQGATQVAVFTVYGDERALPYYGRYGFRPKMVMLEIANRPSSTGER